MTSKDKVLLSQWMVSMALRLVARQAELQVGAATCITHWQSQALWASLSPFETRFHAIQAGLIFDM